MTVYYNPRLDITNLYMDIDRAVSDCGGGNAIDESDHKRVGKNGIFTDEVIANVMNVRSDLWTLYLLRASSLQDANRWPEARAALQQGLALSPDQPLLLNFMGYAKLERGEDLDSAEAMIRKASELAPDDASITDSLGWALFKRGKTEDAIATLQKAAEKDPDQAEIQEHLGDALFKSGRRYEARFAWNAALVTAEDDIAVRVREKLTAGLTAANAAP